MSESPDDLQAEPSAPDRQAPRPTVRLFALVAIVAIVIDQLTKIWAVAWLEGRDSVTVVPGLIDFTFLRNPGAALGTGSGLTVVLTVIAVAVVVVVIRMSARLRDRGWAVGVGLLLGGAVGNLIDRLVREPAPLRGHVVDFIDYGPFVGNVADVALTFAAVFLIVQSWRGIALDGTREVRR